MDNKLKRHVEPFIGFLALVPLKMFRRNIRVVYGKDPTENLQYILEKQNVRQHFSAIFYRKG